MQLRRITFFVLALVTLCPIFMSCSTKIDVNNSGLTTDTSQEVGFKYNENFDGQVIKIFCVNKERHPYGEIQFVPVEGVIGNVINDAVSSRNNTIEEKYGLKIQVVATSYPSEEVKTLIQAGSCDYDIVVDSVDRMVTSVTDNFYQSLDSCLDLDNEWWDRSSINSLTLSDKHFFVAGDALITDDDNIYLTLFNKKMYAENAEIQGKYGDIYKLVNDGKFTYDAFYEMCKLVSHSDENGNWGFNATYGNLSHGYGATIMMNGAGVALAEKQSDGTVTLNPGTEKALNVFDGVYKIMSDKNITQRAELIIGQGPKPSKYGFSELQSMFEAGRGLFYNTTSSSITVLKNLENGLSFQLGVLPIPKYNEQQKNYYCAVNRYHSSVIGIPISNTKNLRATAFLLEALGYYSKDVKKAYFETTLKLQAVEEDNDAKMLDLIYSNRFYDLGSMFKWGNNDALVQLYFTVINDSGSNTIVSKWESIKDSVESDMKTTLEKYKENIT